MSDPVVEKEKEAGPATGDAPTKEATAAPKKREFKEFGHDETEATRE